MTDRNVAHNTVTVQRVYDASAERVFHAWTDAALLERWYLPGDDTWEAKMLEHDLRVGGGKRIAFGTSDETYIEDCHYVDMLADRRIAYAMTISRGNTRLSTSMVTVELTPRGSRCEVRITDQIAILDGNDSSEDRERGWGETLDRLPSVLGDA